MRVQSPPVYPLAYYRILIGCGTRVLAYALGTLRSTLDGLTGIFTRFPFPQNFPTRPSAVLSFQPYHIQINISTEGVATLLTFVVSSEWNDHHPIGDCIASVLTDTVKGIKSRRFGSSSVRAWEFSPLPQYNKILGGVCLGASY